MAATQPSPPPRDSGAPPPSGERRARPRPGPADPPVDAARFAQLFVAVMLPMFLGAVDQTMLATATPAIVAELGGLRDAAWISVGYLIAATVAVPVYGRLGDRFGRRGLLLTALALFAAGSVACGLAGSLDRLAASRVLQGLGGGGLMTMSQALIGELVAPRQRARFQAWFAALFATASIGGPVIGGLVVAFTSWRWLFWANLPLIAFAAWRLLRLPPSPHAPDAARAAGAPLLPDAPGVGLFAVAAATSLMWLTFGGNRFDWASPASAALGGTAALAWAWLVARERRHPRPFLPIELLRIRGVALMAGVVACFAACMFAMVFLLPIWLQLGQRVGAAGTGLLMLPLTGGLVVGSAITGRVVARTGRPTAMPVAGLALSSAALAAIAAIAPEGAGMIALSLAVGIGFGTVMPTSQLVVQTLAGRERLGIAAATVSLSRSSGAAVGTAAFGALVFALLQGLDLQALVRADAPVPEAVTGAFRVAFGCVAALSALGAAIASRLPALRL